MYRSKALQELLLDFARKESNWDIKLAALEVLVAWGTQKAKESLQENEIGDLPAVYYHRANMLRGAIEGKPGYREWVLINWSNFRFSSIIAASECPKLGAFDSSPSPFAIRQ